MSVQWMSPQRNKPPADQLLGATGENWMTGWDQGRLATPIDNGAFKQDLSHAVSQVSSISDYNNHAPRCRCTVRTRKPTPWFSSIAEQFCELKRERRQAERQWLKSKLTVHKQIYDSIKQKVTNLADKVKQAYYSTKIQSSTTCKQLFQNFNTIPGQTRSSPLPSTFDSDYLPNVFSDYFTEKNPQHQK